jgi:DNA-binding FadR family transcriptional regulator
VNAPVSSDPGEVDALALRRAERGSPTGQLGLDAPVRSNRAEMAAERIAGIVRSRPPGTRLGTKADLRADCGVSIGTLNEALRLLQSRGLVTVRPGPGGGLFAAEQSPMVRLGNSVLALDAAQTSVAEAVRIRDALDPLLVEDALWHASPADIVTLRTELARMEDASTADDATAFVHANWALHARIAEISPSTILRSLYLGLLDLIESHTLDVLPVRDQSLPDYLRERFKLHTALVDAIADHDSPTALGLIREHNTSG